MLTTASLIPATSCVLALTDTNDWMLGIVATLIVAMIIGGIVMYGEVKAMRVTLDRVELDISDFIKLDRRVTRIEDHLDLGQMGEENGVRKRTRSDAG